MEKCKASGIKYFEVPVAFDATVIVVNNANSFLKQITVAELKKIWEPSAQGKIKKWKDVNPAWPDKDLRLYGAGADSGTFDYFTEAIVGKAKSSRGDYTASEDDNVLVKGVASDVNALGYIPFSYYEANRQAFRAVPVVNATGTAVLPSAQAVNDGTYAPLSRPLFLYISEKSYARSGIREFVEFYLQNALKLVAESKYVPLPEEAYGLGLKHILEGKVGTAFGGHSQVGLKIKDLKAKEKSL